MADTPAPPTLPGYDFDRELGRGGMGTIYLYRDREMDRPVAVKLLAPEVLARPGNRERFQREIQAAARLCHPNIVAAYTAVRVGDGLALCMEYVAGDDLTRVVEQDGPVPAVEASAYIAQAAAGLQHAFDKGMVHRDIKPGNLMRALDGRRPVVKILDFGLAKLAGRRELDGDSGLTRYGQVLGTPDFIAPEQIRDTSGADVRSDLYSLGCTFYYLLAGRPPFRGASLFDLFEMHINAVAPPIDAVRPGLPPGLGGVIARLMAKNPADRYQTPAEVVEALSAYCQPGTGSHPVVTVPAESSRPTEPFVPATTPSGQDETGGSEYQTPGGYVSLAPADFDPPAERPKKPAPAPARPAGSPGRLVFAAVVGFVVVSAVVVATALYGPSTWQDEQTETPTPATTAPTPVTGSPEARSPATQSQTDRKSDKANADPPQVEPDGFTELFGPGRFSLPAAVWQSGPALQLRDNRLAAAGGQAVLFGGDRLGDFDLKAEVSVTGGAGLLVRGDRRAAGGAATGYLVGLGQTGGPEFVAGAVNRWRSDSAVRKPLAAGDAGWTKPGEPVTLVVEARGEELHVRVGDRPKFKVLDSAGYAGGQVGLATAPGAALEVTRLAVKPVRPPATPAATADPGFESLVTPDSLAGWQVEGDDRGWEAVGTTVTGRQPGGGANTKGALLSAEDFADFTLRFEYRLEPGATALVALRAVPEERFRLGEQRFPAHPSLVLNSRTPEARKSHPTGTIDYLLVGGRVLPPGKADRHPDLADGEWHRTEVTVQLGSVRVVVDDRQVVRQTLDTTAKNGDPSDFPAGLRRDKGRVGFTPFAGEMRVREVRVKRL